MTNSALRLSRNWGSKRIRAFRSVWSPELEAFAAFTAKAKMRSFGWSILPINEIIKIQLFSLVKMARSRLVLVSSQWEYNPLGQNLLLTYQDSSSTRLPRIIWREVLRNDSSFLFTRVGNYSYIDMVFLTWNRIGQVLTSGSEFSWLAFPCYRPHEHFSPAPSALMRCDQKAANVAIARFIPLIIGGIIGYASWAVTKQLCSEFLPILVRDSREC